MRIEYADQSIKLIPEDEFEIAFIRQFTCNELVEGAWANGRIGDVGVSFLEFAPKYRSYESRIELYTQRLRLHEIEEKKREESSARRRKKKENKKAIV